MRIINGEDYLSQSEILEQLGIQKETFQTIRGAPSVSYKSAFQSQINTQMTTPDEIKLRRHTKCFPEPLEINGEELWKIQDVNEWRKSNF